MSPRSRLLALGLVVFVSFGDFILRSTYIVAGVSPSVDPRVHHMRLLEALIGEVGSLAVLWYVLSAQGRGWKNIGWKLEWMDLPRGVSLFFAAMFVSLLIVIPVQLGYHSYAGHYLAPKSLKDFFGFGISTLSIAFICVNPFFEELIVRGYLMSEIFDLGGNGVLAVLMSVALQMSYHLYQGFSHGIVLTTVFVVFSIYFCRTRRVVPVVLAHLCIDALALATGKF